MPSESITVVNCSIGSLLTRLLLGRKGNLSVGRDSRLVTFQGLECESGGKCVLE